MLIKGWFFKKNVILIYAYHNFDGTSGQVLLVIISLYTNDLKDDMFDNKPFIRQRVIRLNIYVPKLLSTLIFSKLLPEQVNAGVNILQIAGALAPEEFLES